MTAQLPIEVPKATALLVVDMQVDFLDPKGRLPVDLARVPRLIERVNAAIAEAQSRGALVVHIGNAFPRWSIANVFRKFAAIVGSPGAALDPRVTHEEIPYVPKERGDAFTNPELPALLARSEVRRVLVAGVFAGHCVRATVRGALARGYEVHVLADGVASRSDGAAARALGSMGAMGASVVAG